MLDIKHESMPSMKEKQNKTPTYIFFFYNGRTLIYKYIDTYY